MPDVRITCTSCDLSLYASDRIRSLWKSHRTLEQNLAFGLERRKTPKDERGDESIKVARIIGLNELLKRKPVTHNQVEAMTLGQRVCVLRDGKLQQVDSLQQLFETPVNLFVAGFIGSPAMNFTAAPSWPWMLVRANVTEQLDREMHVNFTLMPDGAAFQPERGDLRRG